ncbi:hypothetical protein QA612_04470 [Evansella sp. AB-P1]|uniref:hypothetical protein n=1 Tax=Evansella sp. AB-P1 TaxID=3037653 RepID=UPI00241DD2C1|nr:hypothetical protein [Evansella sp. AB-P1]MDG5786735.1 hypothetical protein [Evansella sp. AB-P1]
MKLQKDNWIEFSFILLLIVSYFLPWYHSYNNSYSLFHDAVLFFEIIVVDGFILTPFYWGDGIGIELLIHFWYYFGALSLSIPVLSAIALYKIYKQKKYTVLRNIILMLTFTMVLVYFLDFLLNPFNSPIGTTLEIGFYLSTLALVCLGITSFLREKIKTSRLGMREKCPSCKEKTIHEKAEKYCLKCGYHVS